MIKTRNITLILILFIICAYLGNHTTIKIQNYFITTKISLVLPFIVTQPALTGVFILLTVSSKDEKFGVERENKKPNEKWANI